MIVWTRVENAIKRWRNQHEDWLPSAIIPPKRILWPVQSKTKQNLTLEIKAKAFRGLRHKFSPNKHKFSNISSRKHIIQMRRTWRSCNYLRLRTGTNLLTAFSIETTLVELSRGFTEIPSSLVSLSSDTSKGKKKKLFLLGNVSLFLRPFTTATFL